MLNLIAPRRARSSDLTDAAFWRSIGASRKSVAGPVVSEELALTYSAVWCATRVLCEPIGSLPCFLYRRLDKDNREIAGDDPRFDLLHSAPNAEMGTMGFREGRAMHQVNFGNGFAEIERNAMGEPIALWPIHAARVQPVRRSEQGYGQGFRYRVTSNSGEADLLRASEMLHLAGVMPDDGFWGRAVIPYARESIGLGLATERHGATFFGSGGQPKGILTSPGMKDRDTRRAMREEWKEIHGHPDSGEIAILPVETSYTQITIPNDAAQFLQTRAFNTVEIARWYGVPPHRIMNLDKANYASLELASLEFVIYSLLPWLRRWEEQMSLKLLTSEERAELFVEFQLAGLLRGDIKTRMSAYQTALMYGVMTINECRRLENLNSIGPAGDVNYLPANMTTAERLLQDPVPDVTSVPVPALPADDGETDTEAETEDPADETATETADEGDMAESQMLASVRAAAEEVFRDTLARLYTKEANEITKALTGKDFLGWLGPHVEKHGKTLAAALPPAVKLLHAVQQLPNNYVDVLSSKLRDETAALLTEWYNTKSHAAFKAAVAKWPTERAAEDAKAIISGDRA